MKKGVRMGFTILFVVLSAMAYADGYEVIDGIYVLGQSELNRKLEVQRSLVSGENADAELEGYSIGYKEEMKKMNFSISLTKGGELSMTIYTENPTGIKYRINGSALEIYKEDASLWFPFGEFNSGRTLLTLTNGTLLDVKKE